MLLTLFMKIYTYNFHEADKIVIALLYYMSLKHQYRLAEETITLEIYSIGKNWQFWTILENRNEYTIMKFE